MTNEEKVRRLERLVAEKTSAAKNLKLVFAAETSVAELTADAAVVREAAQLMREREGKSLLTERDWKTMYEAQERDLAALRKRVGELEADLATAGSNVHTLRDELREAQQQMAADAMLIAEAQRGAEIVADTERRLERRIAELEAERDAARAGEARAVEALEAEQRAAHWRNLARITDKHEDALEAGRLSEIAQRLRHGIVLVLTNTQPALDWLAQQRREAAARELEALMESEWKWEEFGLKAGIHARIGALTSQQPTACSRSEVRGEEKEAL
jgi:chromosome segregation ATPase